MGVGAPPLMRSDIPQIRPDRARTSLRAAVGDVCSRFFDRDGEPVDFEGRDRLIALELEALRHIPVTIAVAVGKDKIDVHHRGARGAATSTNSSPIPRPPTAILDSPTICQMDLAE